MSAGLNIGQVNFSKGVLSKEIYARVDIASYNAGLKRGINVVLMKRGGFQNRMGTRFVYKLPGPGRLFPFAYSLEQPYALVFTQGQMRPMAFGGMVLEQELQIQSITNDYPAKVTINYHGYEVGDEFLARGVVGMGEINDRVLTVIGVIDEHNFTVDIDSSSFGAFTSASGGIVRTAPAPPPPVDPPVPPVVPPPPPPSTVGGGTRCVTVDTLILMADGSEKLAGDLRPGDMVQTRHEETMALGAYRVQAAEISEAEVWKADFGGRVIRATPNHLVWWQGAWEMVAVYGRPDGRAQIVKISVEHARTYISNGLLSHNIKPDIP